MTGPWQAALAGQHDLATFAAGLHDRGAHLERCHRPAAIVRDRLALDYRLVHLLHLQHPRATTAVYRDLPPSLVAIDEHAVRRLPDVAALEARHRDAEPGDIRARA